MMASTVLVELVELVCAVEFVLFLVGHSQVLILEVLFFRDLGNIIFWKGQVKTPIRKTARSYQYISINMQFQNM